MTDFGNSNIPHGSTDEGERGVSDRERDRIEDNWSRIKAYLGKQKKEPQNRCIQCEKRAEENKLRCYNCDKEARREGARVVKNRLVCEDCYAELNFKTKSDE